MSKYVVSIVVPTLNRPKHLKKALRSLLTQTRLPDEVIIVDQSDDSRTESLINDEKTLFLSREVGLKYIKEKEKSIARARNVGLHAAVGEIVFFLDDDMTLDKQYINEILKVYREHPNATGIQGILIEKSPYWEGASTRSILLNSIRKVFLVTHWEKDSQTILSSGDMVIPHPLTKTIEADIIYPAISSFKREIARDFYVDEKLKGYSWGEEYFTLKLNLHYPHSLYVTPRAKVFHNHAPTGRPTDKKLHYLYTAYELYNFSRNINPSLKNWTALVWKSLGRIAITLLGLHRTENRARLLYTLQSYRWALWHFGEVRNGQFSLKSLP